MKPGCQALTPKSKGASILNMPRAKAALSNNPIRKARQQIHKSLNQFAEECNINMQALFLNENGVYPDVLPAIQKTLRINYSVDIEDLRQDYVRWIYSQRQTFQNKYYPYKLPEPDLTIAPFKAWRESLDLTYMQVCKQLCIQPSLVHRLEKGKSLKLPEQIRVAFIRYWICFHTNRRTGVQGL